MAVQGGSEVLLTNELSLLFQITNDVTYYFFYASLRHELPERGLGHHGKSWLPWRWHSRGILHKPLRVWWASHIRPCSKYERMCDGWECKILPGCKVSHKHVTLKNRWRCVSLECYPAVSYVKRQSHREYQRGIFNLYSEVVLGAEFHWDMGTGCK